MQLILFTHKIGIWNTILHTLDLLLLRDCFGAKQISKHITGAINKFEHEFASI